MNDSIKIKGGSGDTPPLQDRELGYNKEEKALYIGTPDGNVRLCGVGDITALSDLIAGIDERLKALEENKEGDANG